MQYCGTPEGACSGDATCRLKPFTCPQEFAFVCGCDGTTYVSACEAERAGVSVASQGACGTAGTCPGGCAANQFCATPDGMCSAQGACMTKPDQGQLCGGSPVCGCDGANYASACDAAKAGVSVLTSGTCAPP